jgi:TrmH family RNA methyltransferase
MTAAPTRQRLRDLAALARRKGRDALGLFLVEGVRSVEAAVAAGAPLVEILVSHEAAEASRVAALAERAAVPVHRLPARDLDRVGDAQAGQGVVAVAARVVQERLPDPATLRAVVALDGVQDPGNVGAILRSAAWFGADLVLLDARSADPEGPKAVRASMGGLWDVPVARVPDLADALDALRAAGLAVWGADMAGVAPAQWRPGAASVLVMGSEAHGLSPDVAARLDGVVSIPRGGARAAGGVESLNVVVAAGILLHHRAGQGGNPGAEA